MEEQEDSTEAYTVWRPCSTQDSKGKSKGKMHCKWGGPFIATTTTNEAAFKLHRMSGKEEPYTCNVDML
jgi:hypothetical protein